MTKIDIFSGFLGAGKTTLIKKLIKEAYAGEKLVLIENEFGEIGIDGGFLKDAGINITEMNSGCICCSLVGNFSKALEQVLTEYNPDRIIIEPSGVGKLSDVIKAVQNLSDPKIVLNSFTTVADATKCKMYMKNFGEFYNNQIEHANSIVLSRTDGMDEEKLAAAVALLREKNPDATIITTPWDKIDGKAILDAMEHKDTMAVELEKLRAEQEEEHHHHHHDDDDEDECYCHHDHDEDEHEHHHHHDDDDDDDECCCHHDHDEDEHEHHHHNHDEEKHEHHHHDHDEHEHHHEHDEDCDCGCHDHDHDHEGHHHHHHADEIFASCGGETARKYTSEEIRKMLEELNDSAKYGEILRAKGIVDSTEGEWIHFDFVPGEADVRHGSAGVIGRVCIIGAHLKEDAIRTLFKL